MSAANVLKFIKEKEAEFVDLRFTDPRGKLQHLTMDKTVVDEEMFAERPFSSMLRNLGQAIGTRRCPSRQKRGQAKGRPQGVAKY